METKKNNGKCFHYFSSLLHILKCFYKSIILDLFSCGGKRTNWFVVKAEIIKEGNCISFRSKTEPYLHIIYMRIGI